MTLDDHTTMIRDACEAYHDGRIDEAELTRLMIGLPVVEQASAPDTDWYDAIVVNRGPVFGLRQNVYDGALDADVYARVVRAMLEAGHQA